MGLVSGRAYKLGDVLTSMDGTTVVSARSSPGLLVIASRLPIGFAS